MVSIRALAVALVITVTSAGGTNAGTFIGAAGDGKTSIYYDPATGEIGIDPDGMPVGLFDIQSASGIFTASANLPPTDLVFTANAPDRKSWVTFQPGAFNTAYSLGLIARPGLSLPFLLQDLTLTGSGGMGTPNRTLDLMYPGATPVAPPLVVDADMGSHPRDTAIAHRFTTSAGESAVAWTDLTVSGPGTPMNPPTLSLEGVFSWNSSGSPLGLYNFDVTGTNYGGTDVGRLTVNLIAPPPEPPVVIDMDLGDKTQGLVIGHRFSTSAGDSPITWSDLVANGPASPVIPPMLTSDGYFSWNLADSPAGLYNFEVTATGAGGSDVGRLTINLVAPPPQPPVVDDSVIVAVPDETIVNTFVSNDPDTSLGDLTRSNFTFEGLPVVGQPTFDPATQIFIWDTTDSPDGVYAFRVTATDLLGASDIGTLLIGLGVELGGEPEVPEPAAWLLALPGLIGWLNLHRCRTRRLRRTSPQAGIR